MNSGGYGGAEGALDVVVPERLSTVDHFLHLTLTSLWRLKNVGYSILT
jgi:hypothetical protein